MTLDLIPREVARYDASTFPTPRAFQDRAHAQLREGAKAGHRCQVLMAPTGAGKTYLGMRTIHEALLRYKSAIFLCDRTTLINQTSAVADKYGLASHGIIQANHWRVDNLNRFQIASTQTLARRGWPKADVIVIDECFPAGTRVSTPSGEIPIEQVRAGDVILTAAGTAPVLSTFSKVSKDIITVGLNDGTEFECTEDHPIFTDAGWVAAGLLERGQGLFSVQAVRRLWLDDHAVYSTEHKERRVGDGILGAEVLQQILRQEIEQSHAQGRGARQDRGNAQGDSSSTISTGRKWQGANGNPNSGLIETWAGVVCGVHPKDQIEAGRWVSTPLQDRPSQRVAEGGNRAGWLQPLRDSEAGARPEEGRAAPQIRVESVTPSQCGSGRTVFNLRVGGHPSYFADGVLVHNCHTMYKTWADYIQTTDAHVIGLSATPFSPGLGRLFSNLVNAATMDELTREGILVPMVVYSCKRIDMTGAETKAGGEWADGDAARRGMEIIGDVVSEWSKYASDRKTIVFGATIAHCEEMARQFNEVGIRAATFTADTTPEEREELLKEYRKPDSHLRVLISVEALAKGFDVDTVGCVCDCRPLRKSLSTAIQMWGRGLRCSPDTGKTDCILLDFSGNIVRFADDYADIFYNGLDALDAGEKLDRVIRKDDEEKEGNACPSCGYKPCGKRCIACGFERVPKQSLVSALAGEMVEFKVGKATVGDKMDVWAQAVTLCRSQGKPETANGRASHLYKSITGVFPRGLPGFDETPNVTVSRAVLNKNRANLIAYRSARAAA
jgi:DNA repair protein RadD